ncbi:MAG: hypothetical protein A2W61_08005 [Deltaproteobacteria bacterium RIFCSPLOWO2_01_44_7]|nr:MAG: hypothetical protein A2712_10385 [Deltaproteobacteria bacterium RIFCSPHIGHO2_01_FULL_43_49]OGQ15516.1 MAG: hypothetical protein A3D22_10915 [Deltaproteobacteria bacterium RIFCSPHIGHO2_02_FULL_44_53]OGQ28458.1 MAG: hypothetical protein A3D98_03100 [Deltaproteobacteria bacterium RIFCSPHIGHO2_12_FULL_44_21]OGQ32322.1 MAG: hypothetical protein A2979_00760 [Deltaproteobacteria bacterium RIFCSPLOWO2_01_FULL_45_74]OGQ37685.1 MAG: hypothetical protein A2W61_08005 [Deltaproteobacteria bacterium 
MREKALEMRDNALNLKVFVNKQNRPCAPAHKFVIEGRGTGSKTALSDGMKRFLDALVEDMVRNMLEERK